MELYKALIIEDVQDTSNYIRQRIQMLCPMLSPVAQAFTLEEAYTMIITTNYDIVFLDIQMPEGTSFDLLKRLTEHGNINFEIVFITGESAKEFTLRAIKYSALDFLYKPLDDSELVVAVNKAVMKLSNQNHNKQVKILLDRMEEHYTTMKSNRIAFHLFNSLVEFVSVKDILYLEADGVVSKVYLNGGESFTTNRNLGFYKEMLIVDYSFLLISNSILINPDYIKQYNHQMLQVVLLNGKTLQVSRRRGKEIREVLTSNKRSLGFSTLLNFIKKRTK